MALFELLDRLIDTRAYASMWFWIGLVLFWALQGHRPLGVPGHVLGAARRGHNPGALSAWLALTLPGHARPENPWSWAAVSFVLGCAAVLGFGYGADLAQIVALNGTGIVICGLLTRNLARDLAAGGGADDEPGMARRIWWLQMRCQWIGMLALGATALWGLSVLVRRNFG